MQTSRTLAGAAIAVGFVAAAAAQDVDIKAILTKVDEATKALKGVTYTIESFRDGPDKDSRPRVKGVVSLQRTESPSGIPLARAEITVKPPGDRPAERYLVVHDGKEYLRVDHNAKKFERVKTPDNPQALGPFLMVFFQEYTHPRPFSDELNASSTRYEGKKTINGVECHVIYVVYEQAGADARWYFGVTDHLPRRVDRMDLQAGGNAAQVMELADVKPDPAFDAKTFAITPPEDYEDNSPGLLAVGRTAPPFTLHTPDGKPVSLTELKGKVVVLDFWASWSTQSKNWLPIVQKTYEKYKDKRIVFLGVNAADNKDIDAAAFMKEKGCTYGVLVKGDDVARQYRVNIPTTYVIGRDGKVAFSMWKFKPDDPETESRFNRAIEAALAAE